jgi:hypothetical protein
MVGAQDKLAAKSNFCPLWRRAIPGLAGGWRERDNRACQIAIQSSGLLSFLLCHEVEMSLVDIIS